jgi:thioredoxin-like negative regulator of GroEL
MLPIVHGLEEQYASQIDFLYMNVEDPATAAARQQLGYRVQPHFFLLDADGTVVQQWLGPVSAAQFEEAFQSVIQ